MSSPDSPPSSLPPDTLSYGAPTVRKPPLDALSISGWLCAINVGVFILGHVIYPGHQLVDRTTHRVVDTLPSPVDDALSFSYAMAIQHWQVWRFVTFQFVHANVMHIAGNMLGLLSLGPVMENFLGRRRFLAFYLLCGMVGPVGFLVLMAAAGRDPTTNLPVFPADSTLVGASAGVFGVLVGAAVVAPREWVQLLVPPTPVRLRTAAILMLIVAFFTVAMYGGDRRFNAGGEAAHLGGAAMGWWLARRPDRLDWAERIGGARRLRW